MPPQTADRKAYRKWYHAHESQSVKDARRAWKKTPKGKRCVKNTQLKATYGITLLQYEALLITQNGCCAICDRLAQEFKKGLHLDHNHATGKIRGLICPDCSTRLVAALESPPLEKAKEYLSRYL